MKTIINGNLTEYKNAIKQQGREIDNLIELSENKLNLNIDNTLTLLNIFIEDSLILPLSIYYTPNIITISCVLALKQRYNLTNINIKELIALSEYDLDKQEIQDCFALINKIIIAKADFIKNITTIIHYIANHVKKTQKYFRRPCIYCFFML